MGVSYLMLDTSKKRGIFVPKEFGFDNRGEKIPATISMWSLRKLMKRSSFMDYDGWEAELNQNARKIHSWMKGSGDFIIESDLAKILSGGIDPWGPIPAGYEWAKGWDIVDIDEVPDPGIPKALGGIARVKKSPGAKCADCGSDVVRVSRGNGSVEQWYCSRPECPRHSPESLGAGEEPDWLG